MRFEAIVSHLRTEKIIFSNGRSLSDASTYLKLGNGPTGFVVDIKLAQLLTLPET